MTSNYFEPISPPLLFSNLFLLLATVFQPRFLLLFTLGLTSLFFGRASQRLFSFCRVCFSPSTGLLLLCNLFGAVCCCFSDGLFPFDFFIILFGNFCRLFRAASHVSIVESCSTGLILVLKFNLLSSVIIPFERCAPASESLHPFRQAGSSF